MTWEVDWAHPENTGSHVMARNLDSGQRRAREWHLVASGYLRLQGVVTPTFRPDAWEIDWSIRSGKLVQARNPASKMPSAREWHFVDFHTLSRAGICWKPARASTGRRINAQGYVVLTRRGLSAEDRQLAELHRLFLGARALHVMEHRLVALKKYGRLPDDAVVRHLNGKKDDNRPENLVLGTTQENTADHVSARLMAAYWRERALAAEQKLAEHGFTDQVRDGTAIATIKEALA